MAPQNPLMRGAAARAAYAGKSFALLLSQNAVVAIAIATTHTWREPDLWFWLLPFRRFAMLPNLSAGTAALGFIFALAVGWMIARLSFRRATQLGYGYVLAALSIIPAVQLLPILLLTLLPDRHSDQEPVLVEKANVGHVLQGALAGIAIIVLAVLVSAVTFGAYGWGLFVGTPFFVGVTTAYLANRETLLDLDDTTKLVIWAAALGCVALIMFALEGLVCIVLVAPLGGAMAAIGGVVGRAIARRRYHRSKPMLSLALLPLVFALEALAPPATTIDTDQSIVIDAPAGAVWRTLISDEPIGAKPQLVAAAGLAYPIRGRLVGTGVGAERIGEFSTGNAVERVTVWEPRRRLSFRVISQPPMMEEMSPYRRVHAPHVNGYFDTGDTTFRLDRVSGTRTRLTVRASHLLRIDPAIYWAPMAQRAAHMNVQRVLESVKERSERRPR